MNNSQFDNKASNTVVSVVGTLIRMFERSVVVFFDGLRSATVHGTPSIVGFFAALSPLVAPMAMAAMTSVNLQNHFGWFLWQAILLGASLEIVGFPLWVFVTESIFMDGWKGTTKQMWLLGSVIVYEAVIIVVNAILGSRTMVDFLLLLFLCMLPALCGVAYSYSNKKNEQKLQEEQNELRESAKQAEIRKEKNDLSLKKFAAKHGFNPLTPAYQAETPQVKLNTPKTDWRLLTQAEKKACKGMDYKDIMSTYQVGESTAHLWKKRSNSL